MHVLDSEHPSLAESRRLLDELPRLPRDEQVEAVEELLRTSSPEIRQQMLHLGSALLSDDRLVSYLRADGDAVLRNAGLEILKLRGGRGFRVALELLRDPDPDVVLQAVLILDHLKNPRALEPLLEMLSHDDPNVVQAAITAIGHLGDRRAVADLIPFLEADPWLQMAAVEALGDLRCPEAVEPLTDLLTDLMVGPTAAEAMARIGGPKAGEALGRHWLKFQDRLEPEAFLGLLAHVLEGGAPPALVPEELEESVARFVPAGGAGGDGGDPALDPEAGSPEAVSAARILLALGSETARDPALEVLALHRTDRPGLPACLRHRPDLMEELLLREAPLRTWGLLLAARFPTAAPPPALATAVEQLDEVELPALIQCLTKVRSPRLDEPLLELYLRLPEERRPELHPSLLDRRARLRIVLEERAALHGDGAARDDGRFGPPGRREIPSTCRLVLQAVLGEPTDSVVEGLRGLSDDQLLAVLPQLTERPEVLRRLPWDELLDRAPQRFAAPAADAAVRVGLEDLVPRLRALLEELSSGGGDLGGGPAAERDGAETDGAGDGEPSRRDPLRADLIRALGELGDRQAVPQLRSLARDEPALAPLALQALGEIGGAEARDELHRTLETGRSGDRRDEGELELERIAYRALSLCATAEDEETFVRAADHGDWNVRLAATEVLGRSGRGEYLPLLARLASDPVTVVSQRALSFLES